MKKLLRNPQKKHPSEQGQSLVEFAISVVILFSLMAGIVDLGVAFINFVAMRDAAQEAAVYGSLHPKDCTGIEAFARESSETLLDDVDVEILVGGAACSNTNTYACAGNPVQVTVAQPHYPISMPFLGSLVSELNLRATIRDTILQPYSATCPTPPYP